MTDLECTYDESLIGSLDFHRGYGDLRLDANDEPFFANPELQHQYDLLLAAQGHYKHYPEIGVDSASYLNDTDRSEYFRTIRKQFTADGMKVRSVRYDETGNLQIDASYENR